MPTILNNSCINRVAKVLKLKLTSNDLNQLKNTPYDLLPTKVGDKYNQLLAVYVCLPEDHGYSGSLNISNVFSLIYSFSFEDQNVTPVLTFNALSGSGPSYQLSCSEDFSIGVVRPDIELHIYYFTESVSSDFSVGIVPVT